MGSFLTTAIVVLVFTTTIAAQTMPNTPPKPKTSRSLALQEFSHYVGQVWPEDRVAIRAVGAFEGGIPILRMRLTNVSSGPIKLYGFNCRGETAVRSFSRRQQPPANLSKSYIRSTILRLLERMNLCLSAQVKNSAVTTASVTRFLTF
jgi:hypothetical protein